MQSKDDIRTSVKFKLSVMKKQDISRKSEKIIEQLLPWLDNYQVRSIFFPLRDEPQIQKFIDLLFQRGKSLVYPQIDGNILVPMLYLQDAKFRKGRLGLKEIKDAFPHVGEIDVILVPGMAFTQDGKRMGRGVGYYDTFLAQFPHAKKIGLCFQEQLFPDIPMTEYDMPVDMVISA